MTEDDSKWHLLTRTPHYAAFILFKLGCISLSFIFFGFWTVFPLLLLLCVLGFIGFIHRHDLGIILYMLVPSNLFAVSIKFYFFFGSVSFLSSRCACGPTYHGMTRSMKNINLNSLKSFIFQSSLACSAMYSTLLGTMLCLFNTQTYKEGSWNNFFLNPADADDLETLNILIVSIIIAGIFSTLELKINCIERTNSWLQGSPSNPDHRESLEFPLHFA